MKKFIQPPNIQIETDFVSSLPKRTTPLLLECDYIGRSRALQLPALRLQEPGLQQSLEVPAPSPVYIEMRYTTENKEIRERWGEGIWQDEPDEIAWADPITGTNCLMRKNDLGAWCGYIGVPSEDLLDGVDIDSISVHGGVTYTSQEMPGRGFSHKDLMWIGFDCCHMYDFVPGMAASYPNHRINTIYRNREYVENEIRRMISQLVTPKV